jgi:hypothetical protein
MVSLEANPVLPRAKPQGIHFNLADEKYAKIFITIRAKKKRGQIKQLCIQFFFIFY